MPKSLYLIDGHALAYRTYFALSAVGTQRWQTSKGEPTAGIYGFATVLLKFLETEKPDYIAVAFDVGKTFRDEIFPEYKGTRAKMPDDLRPQIERIRQMVDAFNIPRLEMEGFEADDVLGTIAKQMAAQGLGVKIITGDRDLLQLVGGGVIVNLAGNKMSESKDYITDEDVIAKLGVKPSQVVDYKALVGDTSDNIPGVKGVGEKTVASLFAEFKSLDDIYNNLDKIKGATHKKLEDSKDAAYLSYDLARIRTDLNISLDLEHARADQMDLPKLEAFFLEMEFRSLLPRLENFKTGEKPAAGKKSPKKNEQLSFLASEPKTNYEAPTANITVKIIDNEQTLKEMIAALNAAEWISFDTETTSTDEMSADIVGISLAVKAGEGYYIPVGHESGTQLAVDTVIQALREPMTDPKIKKVAHNIKYDYIILVRYGLRVSPLTFDTMVAEWIVDPSSRHLGLKNLSVARLGEEMVHIEELIGKGKNEISMAQVDIQAAANYATADAETTLRLLPLLQQELQRTNSVNLFEEIDMPLISVLADMEMDGVLLDLPFFSEMSKALEKRLHEIEAQVYEAVGKTFNINSTQQLSDVLFKMLKLDPPDKGRKTASGHYSTSADVLEAMSGQHDVVDWVLEHRELSKLQSTYVDALPQQVNPKTGRVHTSYSQTGSITGRLSSSNPNLQNIPIRTELGRRVREGFIAAKGNVLLSIDYSQVELRIIALMANDETMLEAFRQGQDIHTTTAAAIYDIPLEQVNKDHRRHAKAINFGLIYGMSAFGLTRSTDLTLSEADAFVKAYFKRFTGIKQYLDDTRKLAAEQGYVETLFGRKRYFPNLKDQRNQALKNREEREAINSPIQGTAADIMKIAMMRIPPALERAGLKARMLLQVHDEIVIECPENEVNATASVVQHEMSNAHHFSVPLTTEARMGHSWGKMQVIESK